MQAIPVLISEGKRSEPIPGSSKCPQENVALSRLMSKDPILGEVMKILFGKLDETNKKLDSFHNELRSDLDACQDQVNKLLDAKGVEDEKAIKTEMIPTVKPQNSVDKETPSSEDCLGLPTILRQILEQFSDKELINLSLVNKLWNFEARSVLRERGCLKAKIGSWPVCQGLAEFASDLRQMRVVPFSGIEIKLRHFGDDRDTCKTFQTGAKLVPAYQDILDLLPWKHLSIYFWGPWRKRKDCPALVLLKTIVDDYYAVLEEFSISSLDSENADFVQSVIKDLSFPCLKIFKLSEAMTDTPISNGFIKALVSCAPNLQKLYYCHGRKNFNENIMEGSPAVLVPASGLNLLRDHVCESLVAALRTERIDLCLDHYERFDVELLNRFVPMVIQSSQTSLKSLRMDLLFAVPLMCYGMCLENVTDLCIVINDSTLRDIQTDILTLVKGLDFTCRVPKLKRVEIMDWERHREFLLDDIRAFTERGKALAREALSDRAINIKHLKLDGSLGNLTAVLLTEMFPHVTEISVRLKLGGFPFKLLWEHFGSLIELNVYLSGEDETVNLDSVFCGIFPEEVAELRAKDDEYLKAVNIVPVLPSITCMRDLRSINFYHCIPGGRDGTYTFINTELLFTKVTDLLAFQRSRDLAVTLTMDHGDPEEVKHVKPDWSVLRRGCSMYEAYDWNYE